jgi:serine/threonine protein kinase/flagellar motility protein MotE (MotC chaperone)
MPIDPQRVRDIFLAAAELPAADRPAHLTEACGGDADLRAAVERLLAAHIDPASVLESPAANPLPTTGPHTPQADTGTILAGRYKLLEPIGEGGMGEVWVAQQTEPVKRTVAVKLIKHGSDSKTVLARFDAERQALALMDHPNIARVLDAGATPDGRPFFVMELVKGTSITQFCDAHRLNPRERLELFVPVCNAIQHAHQKGVIHRDIKPSNVLVALYDDRPIPKVIDFGVAKAIGQPLTENTLHTGFGTVIGTPQYMSPEQATFNNLDVDTRSDLYSLGVLLYELLVGSTPFTKKDLDRAGVLEMLRVVREVEPPRPSTKLSTADALPSLAANRSTEPRKLTGMLRNELDWIVMKALEKDRTRRYETANGFAADVLRYLADEVVEARPPSAGYRLRKLVRRHKGRVIAASLILLAILAGMTGTIFGLIEAKKQEQEATKQEGLARTEAEEKEAERAKAVAAGNDLRIANSALMRSQEEVLKSNDLLLTSVARSPLRPLGAHVKPEQPFPSLIVQEIEPLWELASSNDERLRIRFVELALLEPVTTRRLMDRSAFVFQAAVGLNVARRRRIEELLGQRLQAKELSLEEQEDAALCLAHLGVLDRLQAARTAATLTQAMTRTTNSLDLATLARGLSAVAARMDPKDAAQVCEQAASSLTQAMNNTTDTITLVSLAQGLLAMTARLDSKDAAKAASTIALAMTKVTNPFYSEILARVLSEVAARMDPKDASEAATTLTLVMTKATHSFDLATLARGLSVVAARMDSKDAAQVCGQAATTLTLAITNTTDAIALRPLREGLSAVAARMDPKDLTMAMTKTTDANVRMALANGLSALAARMDPKDAAEAVTTLTLAMTETTNANVWWGLVGGLWAVLARIDPKDAAQVCGQAATILTQAMTKTTAWNALRPLARGLSAVAVQMDPKDAATILTQAMTKTTDPVFLRLLAEGLSAVAARMDPKDAATTLTQSMTNTTDSFALRTLARGLSAVAARMDPMNAAQVCGQAAITLTQAMTKTTDPGFLQLLAEGLSAVAARMDPKDAVQVCGQAAITLTLAMTKVKAFNSLGPLARGLVAVAGRMDPKDAATTLALAMSKTEDQTALVPLAQGLSAVAVQMDLKEAAEATTTLAQAITRATNPAALVPLAQGLSAVTTRKDPKEAAQLCGQAVAALTQAMTTSGMHSLNLLKPCLSAVLTRESAMTTHNRPQGVTTLVAVLGSPGLSFTALGSAKSIIEPSPPPLSAQTLVDVLKHPFCVGEARRLVLEQLSRHYYRPFTDQWEFVQYVTDNQLPLDLTTPPVRPLQP